MRIYGHILNFLVRLNGTSVNHTNRSCLDRLIQHREAANLFLTRWQTTRHCNGHECARMKVETETSTIVWKICHVFHLLDLGLKCPCCSSKYKYHKQFFPCESGCPASLDHEALAKLGCRYTNNQLRWRSKDGRFKNSTMKIKVYKISCKLVCFKSWCKFPNSPNSDFYHWFSPPRWDIEETWSNITFDFKPTKIVGTLGSTAPLSSTICRICLLEGSTEDTGNFKGRMERLSWEGFTWKACSFYACMFHLSIIFGNLKTWKAWRKKRSERIKGIQIKSIIWKGLASLDTQFYLVDHQLIFGAANSAYSRSKIWAEGRSLDHTVSL